MNVLDYLLFPSLCIGLYFEVFLLVTFLSKPARAGRARLAATITPKVAIVVPCFNEEKTIGGTVRSLLALDYPKDKLAIVLVDDGSTDGTPAVIDSYKNEPQVIAIHKENGGKHTALNIGIDAVPDAEFIGCLDADSFVDPAALREIVACFDRPEVAAATPAMSVHQPETLLQQVQYTEYMFGIALRHILASLNGLYVTPGPFSFYRRSTVVELGGFRYGHQAEDMEMALRIQRAGYQIENAPRARVYTKAPRTAPKLIKQRTRWTTGFIRNVLYDYRDLIGDPKRGALGVIVLPLGVLAIVSGIILFFVVVFQTLSNLVHTYLITHGIPLSYIFRIHDLEWFYVPITGVVVLSLVVLSIMLTLTIIGKWVSKTPGSLVVSFIAYLFLYGLVAPFWLMRAVRDVATGTKRSWR